ncbi:MAG: LysM peptidoglycan-binding domain-containing protein [Deltaproteobacteria bacterium]|nr:LysM peptidoglycan-binding domain-containing protein [Deltaproteobacteria bacterium]
MSSFHGWGAFLGLALLGTSAGAQTVAVNDGGGPSDIGWTSAGSGDTRVREAARSGGSVAIGGRLAVAPARYVVRRGDTLWDICSSNLRNPWLWPEVWSLNPDITNPHWIYPGQVLRLRLAGDGDVAAGSWGEPTTLGQPSGGTVFFRSEGYIDENAPDEDADEEDIPEEQQPPGRIVASWEDEMMLAYPDLLYVRFDEDFPVQAGQQHTVYRVRETVYDIVDEDSDEEPRKLGRIVEILGTGSVLSYDSEAHLARVRLVESVNPIERGDFVGPIQRNFIVSEPRAAEADLDGRIVATLRPRINSGQGFVVFVNRGYEDGVRDGNRFQIIRANDHYLESNDDDIPEDLPFEWIGECQVLEARKTASTCLITASTREIFVGERVTLSRGR